MQPYLSMDKQVAVKHILWKDINISKWQHSPRIPILNQLGQILTNLQRC